MKLKLIVSMILLASCLTAQAGEPQPLLTFRSFDMLTSSGSSITLYDNGEFWYEYSGIEDPEYAEPAENRLVARLSVADTKAYLQPMIDAIRPNAKLVNPDNDLMCGLDGGAFYSVHDEKFEDGSKTIQRSGCNTEQFKKGTRSRKAADALVALMNKVQQIVWK